MAEKFRWITGNKISDLINALKEYKTHMEFQNIDFNGDKPRQYEEVRRILARKHACWFGPARTSMCPESINAEEKNAFLKVFAKEKDHIKLPSLVFE